MMGRALALAERGRFSTSPNPMVGAVIVKKGRILGEGFHRRAGEPHAEVEALRRAGSAARGATLYVTLEPCNRAGRTGPCIEAVLRAGISRVIVARRDPNPRVAGAGLRSLKRQGVRVGSGLRAQEAALQNERYDVWVQSGMPFVLAKVAASLDGRIADTSGRSRWVSGERSRRRSLVWREEFDAILVGAGTIAADDPRLLRRLGWNRATPQLRIVLDGGLRVPEGAAIFRNPEGLEIWTAVKAGTRKEKRLLKRGVKVLHLGRRGRSVDLPRALRSLGERGVTGLLVEGGSETLASFHEAGLIDRWAIFFTPRLFGGGSAPAVLAGRGVPISKAERLSDLQMERIGEDLLVTGRTQRVFRHR
jgi:diaminohydroxyphosphoribosylaminopyrimidine deaminase/5-amino-6-(5-phosphoribosylamino)uracil reductase